MAPANLTCAFDFLLPVKQWGARRTERELADSPIDMLIDHTDSTYMSGNSVYERQVLQCVVLHQFTYGQARPDSNSLRERERERERERIATKKCRRNVCFDHNDERRRIYIFSLADVPTVSVIWSKSSVLIARYAAGVST